MFSILVYILSLDLNISTYKHVRERVETKETVKAYFNVSECGWLNGG